MSKILKKFILKLKREQNIDELIQNGLQVGTNLSILDGVDIDYSHCWLITIGNNVTLAQRVHILAHDASTKKYLNYAKIGLVTIGDNTFIGADSIILPNVKIGSNCIIGAGSVVTKDVPDHCVYAGNPARLLCTTQEYFAQQKQLMLTRPVFSKAYTQRGNITEEQKQEMIQSLKDGIGYVE